MLSEIFFPENTYKTAGKGKSGLLDKLMLNNRWAFYIKYLRFVLKNRKAALKNRYNDAAWSAGSYDIFKVIENSGGKFSLSGLDNIPKTEGPVVFIGNHMSTAETMVLPCMIAPYKKLTFVVKVELADSRIFGPIMRSRNPITLGRQEARKDMMKLLSEGKEKLDQGYSIIIFPEGTRQKNFDPKKLNSLGIKLAEKAGVKVIPVALKTDFWATSTFGKINRKRTLHFAFGKAVDVSLNPKKAHKEVLEFISTHHKKWKEEEKAAKLSIFPVKAVVN